MAKLSPFFVNTIVESSSICSLFAHTAGIKEPFVKMKLYLELQVNKGSIIEIIDAQIDLKSKIKLLLILHFPNLAIFATKLKWKLDNR